MRYAGTIALLLALLAVDASAQGIIIERVVIDRPTPPPRRPRTGRVRLKAHDVSIRIENQAAVTEVKQVFFNPNRWPVEGIYLFPLPDGASVSAFTMKMGNKQVTGEILDARRASDVYRSIVERRDDPGLLEYAGRRLIRARMFPIPAQGTTDITLRYEQLLEPVGDMLEMVYPLRSDKFSRALVRQTGRIEVQAQAGIATLFSPTHKLDVVRKGEDHVVASFEEMASRADRDLRLLYSFGRKDFGLSLTTHKPAGADGTFLLVLAPQDRSTDKDVLPKDLVFVLDTSGSMGDRGGAKLRQAQAAVGYALGRLDPRDRFNVVAFATGVRPFRDAPVAATRENVDAALAFVKGLQASGGTAIHDALLGALELPRAEGRVPIVIFLTDGLPTIGPAATNVITRAVKEANRAGARLFVLGVGDDVNTELLGDLATGNRGADHYVSERENIELKVSALYDKVASPVLTDVKVTIEGVGAYDVFPREIGDLFKGQQLAIVGRYRETGPRAVMLTGRIGSREVRYVYETSFGTGAEREYLPRLWAVRKVGFLLGEIGRQGEKRELVDEVKRLGTRYGIVTPYTSFLVVEEGELLRRRLQRRPGGAPAPDAPTLREIETALRALADEEDDAAEARAALKAGDSYGAGAVAGKKKSVRYLRAEGAQDARAVGVRTVGAKTFRHVDGVWTDTGLDEFRARHPAAPVERIAYRSEAWNALLADARVARYLSVGSRVRFVHAGTIYEVFEQ